MCNAEFAFKTFWWKIRLLRNIKVGQTIANRGKREGLPTIPASNHPVRPYKLALNAVWLTVPTVGILEMVY